MYGVLSKLTEAYRGHIGYRFQPFEKKNSIYPYPVLVIRNACFNEIVVQNFESINDRFQSRAIQGNISTQLMVDSGVGVASIIPHLVLPR